MKKHVPEVISDVNFLSKQRSTLSIIIFHHTKWNIHRCYRESAIWPENSIKLAEAATGGLL